MLGLVKGIPMKTWILLFFSNIAVSLAFIWASYEFHINFSLFSILLFFLFMFGIQFFSASLGKTIVEKRKLAFFSIITIFIYGFTPIFPLFIIFRVPFLILCGLSVLFVSWLNYRFIKSTKARNLRQRNLAIVLVACSILLAILSYPAMHFASSENCLLYANGANFIPFGDTDYHRACISDLARSTRDTKFCDMEPNPEYCYGDIAELNGDVGVCYERDGFSWRDECVGSVYKGSYLSFDVDELVHDCERILLRKMGDRIQNEEIHDQCLLDIIVETRRLEFCNRIISPEKKLFCMRDEHSLGMDATRIKASLTKYASILYDDQIFKTAIFNPPDREFCSLLQLLTFDRQENSFLFVGGHWAIRDDVVMICYSNIAKLSNASIACAGNENWKSYCRGGLIYLEAVNPNGSLRRQINFTKELKSNSLFGFGVMAAHGNFSESEFYAEPDYFFLVGPYKRARTIAEELEPFNFCDSILGFGPGCWEIVNGTNLTTV